MGTHETSLVLPPHVDLHTSLHPDQFSHGSVVGGGRYRLGEELSSNTHGQVYQALDLNGGGEVALKIFHEPTEAARQQVDRELMAHVALNGQPGIVESLDIGILEESILPRRYLATRFRNGTLHDFTRNHPGNIESLLHMSSQVLHGLVSVHGSGLVHLDIKPKNILRDAPRDAWELTDFGLIEATSELLKHEEVLCLGSIAIWEPQTCDHGPVRGTLGYIAPESMTEGESGPKSDVFAMGVTLFEAATGTLPFQTKDIDAYYDSVVHESPASARALNRAVPAKLDELTRECLSVSPSDRPTSEELVHSIEAI